jgi:hypothetical protein
MNEIDMFNARVKTIKTRNEKKEKLASVCLFTLLHNT